MNLDQYGYNQLIEKHFNDNKNSAILPGRVISLDDKFIKVITQDGVLQVNEKSRFKPVVGDWVKIEKKDNIGLIHEIIPSQSKLTHKTIKDVANVNTIFIVSSLADRFNVKNIEKYLDIAWNSGAFPVIILTKADLCDDLSTKLYEVKRSAPGVDIYAVSSVTKVGLSELQKYFKVGKTIALLGVKGSGKTSLIKELTGFELKQSNQLVLLPNGCVIINNDPIEDVKKEIAEDIFDDIDELARNCRFKDCQHGSEPGCAVRKAIEDGILDESHYEHYIRSKRDINFNEEKINDKIRTEQIRQGREFAKQTKYKNKEKW